MKLFKKKETPKEEGEQKTLNFKYPFYVKVKKDFKLITKLASKERPIYHVENDVVYVCVDFNNGICLPISETEAEMLKIFSNE